MKQPKLPDSVLIGNIRYDITPLPQEQREQGVMGDCSSVVNHRIRIDPNLVGHDAVETMFHELLHAVTDVYGVKLSHRQVYQLSTALSFCVRYNPQITVWMDKIDQYAELIAEENNE